MCTANVYSTWESLYDTYLGVGQVIRTYLQGINHEIYYLAKQDTIFCMISLYGVRKQN